MNIVSMQLPSIVYSFMIEVLNKQLLVINQSPPLKKEAPH
jgi:hypothetical protein